MREKRSLAGYVEPVLTEVRLLKLMEWKTLPTEVKAERVLHCGLGVDRMERKYVPRERFGLRCEKAEQ